MFRRKDRIEIKTQAQFDVMRQAGRVVAVTLQRVVEQIRPGITTIELDALAAESIRSEGALPSFLGYHGFPAHICVSINDEVVHGIPGARVLQEGDLISVDCGAIVDGWHGDAAVSVPVGAVTPELLELSRVTEQSLLAGIAAAVPGARIGDIGRAVETYVRAQGDYGIVEDYVGHGIGTAMHMAPSIPNYGPGGQGPRIVEGMALAIEPMVTLGTAETRVLADDWTVVTADGRPAAHWEHSVAVTAAGPQILTLP